MKKALITLLLVITIFGIFSCTNKIYAAQQVLDNRVEGQLVEIKEKEAKSLEDYKQKYGSDAYGTVAYILNLVSIWSYIINYMPNLTTCVCSVCKIWKGVTNESFICCE